MNSKKSRSGHVLKKILPILVLVVSGVIFVALKSLRKEVEKEAPVPNYPRIEVYTVEGNAMRLQVEAQGTVRPRQQTRLTSRVSGHIEWVSPKFYEGGDFRKGDTLLKLDPLPYQSALAESKSRLALAESVYLQEQEASEQAKRDWEAVGAGEPSQLVLRIPQLNKVKADLEAAEVALQMATENLSYTEIKAPYDGRVQSKMVDVGQAITAQATILGEVFSIESLEVPLALTLDDLTLIRENSGDRKPGVALTGRINGTVHTWNAYLDRTSALVDSRTRMISAYARMEPPFTSDMGAELTPGMFVGASIEGKFLERAYHIPRGAIQPGNVVYKVTSGSRLSLVELNIIRTDAEWAIVTSGLSQGDRICQTPLLFFSEGMQVEVTEPVTISSQPQQPSES